MEKGAKRGLIATVRCTRPNYQCSYRSAPRLEENGQARHSLKHEGVSVLVNVHGAVQTTSMRNAQRRRRRFLSGLFGLLATAPTWALAQGTPRLVRVEGLAFDSLTARPLADAFIAVPGTGRSTTSDSKGRFRLDSVPEGEHTFSMQHAAFDSAGLSGASLRVTVRDRMPKLVLAVPSFATLWRTACGNAPVPKDSALLYGTLRSADGVAARPNGFVEVSWIELVGGGKSLASVGQRRWKRATETNQEGEFALCGVATAVPIELRASAGLSDTSAFTILQLEPTLSRVQRRDVRLPTATALLPEQLSGAGSDSASSRLSVASPTAAGVVTGVVTNAGGVPLAAAIVAVDTLLELRTSNDGRFRVAGVGAGTRQVLVVAIGMMPKTVTMDVSPGETTHAVIAMQPVQLLDAVRVRATASTVARIRRTTYEEHRRSGMGSFRDSTDFAGQTSLLTVLRMVPSLQVQVVRGGELAARSVSCAGFGLFLDGHPITSDVLLSLRPADLAAMEVYTRRLIYPSDAFPCSIMLWTKRLFSR